MDSCTRGVSAVVIGLLATAASTLAASAIAAPPATQVITVAAVGANGQPINGYHESPGNVSIVANCVASSPSAVGDDIYSCSPSSDETGACWPSTPGSLLCMADPWEKRLHRVTYDGPLPQVRPPAVQDPFALVLDDGTRCRFSNGAALGGRDDGYVGVYGCGEASSSLGVLWLPSEGPGACIDRSAPAWTVKVGQLGSPGEHFPPPQTRTVSTAWFAGDAASA